MKFKDVRQGAVFVPLIPGVALVYRKLFAGKAEEVHGGDMSGKLITRPTSMVIRGDQEVQLVDQFSITGKHRH